MMCTLVLNVDVKRWEYFLKAMFYQVHLLLSLKSSDVPTFFSNVLMPLTKLTNAKAL